MLRTLSLENFRNLKATELSFAKQNYIIGPNASGKTSLLESIVTLSSGRSFRTPNLNYLVQHSSDMFRLFGRFESINGKETRIGIERAEKKTKVHCNGKAIYRLTEIINQQPYQLINPESHELLEQGPKHRRKFVDWGVFHVKHQYLEIWQKYHQILRQRNALLKRNARNELFTWTQQLVKYGEQLDQARKDYIQALYPFFAAIASELLGSEPQLVYFAGYPKDTSLAEKLAASIEDDLQRGFTQSGPHRADLQFKIGAYSAQNIYSRGQQKLLVSALRLSQVQYHADLGLTPSLILVDDLPAELDNAHRHKLMALLEQLPSQFFVTCTEQTLLNIKQGPEVKVFHVKHGQIQAVL